MDLRKRELCTTPQDAGDLEKMKEEKGDG